LPYGFGFCFQRAGQAVRRPWLDREQLKPAAFFAAKLNWLLEHASVGSARLDRIDTGVIEGYVVARRAAVGPATVNRELATLRRMLCLAHEWKQIQRVPRIRLLSGERTRDFVLSRTQEEIDLAACPQPLNDIAVLMLESGLRIGEAMRLEWADVTLKPARGARFGFLRVREGKSKNARRIVPLTDRANALLTGRHEAQEREEAKRRLEGKPPRSLIYVFANRAGEPYPGYVHQHLHQSACAPKIDGKRKRIFPKDFVLPSLRHTMLTRLGESGVDAFTIMRIAGHSSITVSQRYIHPTPEAVERAFERLQLSGREAEDEPKRLLPAATFATLNGAVAVSD
jgi:integrase